MPEVSEQQQNEQPGADPTGSDTRRNLTMSDVVALLGKGERTVNRYVKEKRLPVEYRAGKGYYSVADVERLKADLETPVVRGALVPILPVLAVSNDTGQNPAKAEGQNGVALAAFRGPEICEELGLSKREALELRKAALYRAVSARLWLPVDEAVAISGLPKSYLIAQAKAGIPWAVNVGTGAKASWRFNREGLGREGLAR